MDANNGDVRQRIAKFMQAEAKIRRKDVSQEDAQTLRAAANRLNHLLKEFDDAEEARRKEVRQKEVEALRAAALRLDSLLNGVTGKAAMPKVKLRSPKKDLTE